MNDYILVISIPLKNEGTASASLSCRFKLGVWKRRLLFCVTPDTPCCTMRITLPPGLHLHLFQTHMGEAHPIVPLMCCIALISLVLGTICCLPWRGILALPAASPGTVPLPCLRGHHLAHPESRNPNYLFLSKDWGYRPMVIVHRLRVQRLCNPRPYHRAGNLFALAHSRRHSPWSVCQKKRPNHGPSRSFDYLFTPSFFIPPSGLDQTRRARASELPPQLVDYRTIPSQSWTSHLLELHLMMLGTAILWIQVRFPPNPQIVNRCWGKQLAPSLGLEVGHQLCPHSRNSP
jgi:hypothetical protein